MISSLSSLRFTALAPSRTAAAPAAQPVTAGDRLQLSQRPTWIPVVPGKDQLSVRVEPGTTLWSLASLYATDYKQDNTFGKVDARDTAPFIQDLQKANGLKNTTLRTGQTLKVPTSKVGTNLNLDLAIAVQKSVDARRKAGQTLPELDFTALRVGPGPVDSFVVDVRKRGTQDFQRFYVADDLSGQHPNSYLVNLPSETPFEPAKPSTFFQAGKDQLSLTVTYGMTLWSLASKFATDRGGDGKVDGADIKAYIEALKKANNLKGDVIREGQTLLLPTAAKGTNTNLEVAVVIQKAFDARVKAGEPMPTVDYSQLTVTKAPDGTMLVALPLYE
ncbi:MAG TPA: LysM peptidoglycan-binding domain-containing protein, partial [Stenomitos sp.]